MSQFRVLIKCTVEYVGGSSKTVMKVFTVNGDSFAEAESRAIDKMEWNSGHHSAKALSVEIIEEGE